MTTTATAATRALVTFVAPEGEFACPLAIVSHSPIPAILVRVCF